MGARSVNVRSIAPGSPFLGTLVGAILDGELIEGFAPRERPQELATLTLYLPSLRAVRAAKDAFLDALGGGAAILPRTLPLGAADEEEGLFGDEPPDALDLAPAVTPVERHLALAARVREWSGDALREAAGFTERPLVVPSSGADAFRLAGHLARLVDTAATEGADWGRLASLVDADLARYWEITCQFLDIATREWPEELERRGLMDVRARRDAAMRAAAERLSHDGAPGPVIAAGSNNAAPANAALLSAIARLENGAVVLPGLDFGLDERVWRHVDEGDPPSRAGHPQFELKRLLKRMDLDRGDVRPLGEPSAELSARERFVSRAFIPAEAMDTWRESAAPQEETRAALDGVAILEALNEREEALAIAVFMRGCLEKDTRCALVTPDRALARRVNAELERWGLHVDDTAGRPLSDTGPGALARLVAEAGLSGLDPVTLLALLKHPLARFGLPAGRARHAARLLERCALRGLTPAPGLDALERSFATNWTRFLKAKAREDGERLQQSWTALDERDWEDAAGLLGGLVDALQKLDDLRRDGRERPLADYLDAHREALRRATATQASGCSLSEAREAGEALGRCLSELRTADHSGLRLPPRDYAAFIDALMAEMVVRERGSTHPQLMILGALEARLQGFETVVLGGFNEGTWPAAAKLDPFLSRTMRTGLDLSPPEQRTGLAAHDVTQMLGAPQVLLTRAARAGGAPTVPSRWLQRLKAFAGPSLAVEMEARGGRWLAFARALDACGAPTPCAKPAPRPPVALRPRKLSVTEVETLIRDPYAIYARHVLKLSAFEDIGADPSASERGSLFHDVLQRFVDERPSGAYGEADRARLLAIADEEFARYAVHPEVGALWRRRFERAAEWFLSHEASRAGVERHAERLGRMEIEVEGKDGPVPFTLTGRADRIDRLPDGTLAVYDYKTGNPPSARQVRSLSPQLPLEVMMLASGAFGDLRGEVAQIGYYKLSGNRRAGEFVDVAKGEDPAALAERAHARLRALLPHYLLTETQGFTSRAIPDSKRRFEGAYDHLARVQEWSLGEAGEDS